MLEHSDPNLTKECATGAFSSTAQLNDCANHLIMYNIAFCAKFMGSACKAFHTTGVGRLYKHRGFKDKQKKSAYNDMHGHF